MLIERRNILELIGADRRRYHSCVLTCYSFDFHFFEERVLRVLRVANVKNVNVLVDGAFLEQELEHLTGREFQQYKSYGITPIYAKGVFHPKIMLLTGQRHGLLLIGSGNLTSSGLGTNDEVWSAFHLDKVESPNAVLFGAAWRYLQSFNTHFRGVNKQKIDWILRYSPWIEQVSKLSMAGFSKIRKQLEVAFLGDNGHSSLFKQCLALLPDKALRELTVISPYYDHRGVLLGELDSELQPQAFRCVVDTEYGLLPLDMGKEQMEKIQFTDWQDCVKEFDYRYNRLHAKVFHFRYADEEYLLLGSPNASRQGFGGKASNGVNHEAAIMLRRPGKQNYLKDLGIIVPQGKELDLTKSVRAQDSHSADNPISSTKIKILYAEAYEASLSFLVNTAVNEKVILVVSDEWEIELARHEFSTLDGQMKEVSLRSSDTAFRVHLENASGERRSNFMLVHQVNLQAKTNPNPSLQRLGELMDSVYDQKDDVSKLLSHLDFSWVDEEDENKTAQRGSSGAALEYKVDDDAEESADVLSEKDFNKVDEEVLFRQRELLNSTNVRIADFLLSLRSSFSKTPKEPQGDNKEQELYLASTRTGEGGEVEQEPNLKTNGEVEQKGIRAFLNKLNNAYKKQLQPIYKSKQVYGVKEEMTLRALSNLLIGLEVLQMYHGKSYQTEHYLFSLTTQTQHLKEVKLFEKKFHLRRLKKTHPEIIQVVYYAVRANHLEKLIAYENDKEEIEFFDRPRQEPLIVDVEFLENGTPADHLSVKGFLCQVLGKFLILSFSGMKSYEYDRAREKVEANRNRIFLLSVFLILNLEWTSRERASMQILLLDLLHYMHTKGIDKDAIQNIKKQLSIFKESALVFCSSLAENESFFFDYLMPKYQSWKRILNSKGKENLRKRVTDLNRGTIVYDRQMGFCKFISRSSRKITLAKPGFPYKKGTKRGELAGIPYPHDTIVVW